MDNRKPLITEISEGDFRKLDLKGKVAKHDGEGTHIVEVSLNDVLDKELEACLEGGTEEYRNMLSHPVTIAIHTEPNINDDGFYWDKYMNRFHPLRSFEIGVGIPHLYQTRDWLEDRTDYWRVHKRETKVVYRIYLDRKWLDSFVLKHRTRTIEWPFGKTEGKVLLEIRENLLPDGTWGDPSYVRVEYHGGCVSYIPVDENGNPKRKEKQDA